MAEEKKTLEQVVEAIQNLLGFGTPEDITGVVNNVLGADGDENKIMTALQGLFGKAIGPEILSGVVKKFLGDGGINLGNILQMFQGIGDQVGGFDKVAGLVPGAAKAVDAVKDAAGDATNAAADAAKGAADKAADTAKKAAEAPSKKAERKKKWPIVLGVLAAIVVVAGIGMWTWHEQPSFCGAICHTSMDAYLATYEQEDNAEGTDKYGNTVSNTHAMLVQSHKTLGKDCLACHIPALDQQIGEVMETITGNYTVVQRSDGNGFALPEVSLAELQNNAHQPNESGIGDEFCMRSGCHNDRESLAKRTADMDRNPHAPDNSKINHPVYACSDCHKSHRASTLICTQCHKDANKILPEGWVSASESQQLMAAA